MYVMFQDGECAVLSTGELGNVRCVSVLSVCCVER
jgi:hypothetical protein